MTKWNANYFKMSFLYTLVLLFSMLYLSGCDYPPKEESFDNKKPIATIKILPNTPYDAFYKRLTRTLTKHNIKIADYRQTTVPTLHILSEDITTEALEFDENDKLKREDLIYELEYKVTDKFGNDLIKATRLIESKEHSINPDNEITTTNERDMITYELQQTVISQIIDRISSLQIED